MSTTLPVLLFFYELSPLYMKSCQTKHLSELKKMCNNCLKYFNPTFLVDHVDLAPANASPKVFSMSYAAIFFMLTME